MQKVKKQSGFTLVEIAIVLVIIGLLLAGVLKGQELIESSRVKSMAKDLNGFSTMYTSYLDRYHGVPGDDLTATSHTERGWGTTAFTAGDNSGLIGAGGAAVMFPPAATTENLQAYQALRYAGFLSGNGASILPPTSATGGAIGFTSKVFGFGSVNVVCFNNLNGKQAAALDLLLDDGVFSTGSVRSDLVIGTGAMTATASATVYSEAVASGVILCKTL